MGYARLGVAYAYDGTVSKVWGGSLNDGRVTILPPSIPFRDARRILGQPALETRGLFLRYEFVAFRLTLRFAADDGSLGDGAPLGFVDLQRIYHWPWRETVRH